MRAQHGVGHGVERNRQVQIGAVLAPQYRQALDPRSSAAPDPPRRCHPPTHRLSDRGRSQPQQLLSRQFNVRHLSADSRRHRHQAPERCVPAVMSLSGEGEHDVAVLDVHGEWHVLSWEGVTWIALHAPDEKARCLARQLLLGGSNVRSDSADTRCTGDWGNFMRIVSTDPLILACGAVPSCSIGDTCS